jgi:hypothetical protein
LEVRNKIISEPVPHILPAESRYIDFQFACQADALETLAHLAG